LSSSTITQIERRSAERFEVSFHGEYETADGAKDSITVVNVSKSGLQFLTEQMNVLTLCPNTGSTNKMSPISIKLRFELGFELPDQATDYQQVTSLAVQCGIVYVKRHSMTSCVVGCRFEEFLDDASERLSCYLAHKNS
jgi:PilZ domain